VVCTTIFKIVEPVVTGAAISEESTVHMNSEAEAKSGHLVLNISIYD